MKLLKVKLVDTEDGFVNVDLITHLTVGNLNMSVTQIWTGEHSCLVADEPIGQLVERIVAVAND